MSALTVVMQREMKERKAVIMAATIFGLLPPFILIFGKVRGQDSTEIASAITIMVTIAMFFGVAAAAGASMFSRELAEKRLAFYFARPISELTLWGGKTAAAFVLPIIAAAIPLLIATIFGIPFRGVTSMDQDGAPLIAMVPMFFLIVLTHALTLGVRARSPWMAFEIAMFALGLGIFILTMRGMFLSAATEYVGVSAFFVVAATITALAVAGAIGIMRGRSEIVVVQRFTAIAFATIFISLAAIYAAYTAWVRSADRFQLRAISGVTGSAAGPVVSLRGLVRGGMDYWPTYLVNTANDSVVRVHSVASPPRFAENGRTVWEEVSLSFTNARFTVAWTDLNEAKPRLHHTTLDTTGKALGVSPSGRRISITDGKVFGFYDLDTENQIAAIPVPKHQGAWTHHIMWINEDMVRLYVPTDTKPDIDSLRTWMIYELSLSGKNAKSVGTFRGRTPNFTPDRLQILVFGNGNLQVIDGATGTLLQSVPIRGPQRRNSHVVVGSRIAVLDEANGKYVRVFSNGKLEREIKVTPNADRLSVGPEADTALLVVADAGMKRTFIIDLATGTVTPYVDGATPLPSGLVANNVFPKPGSPITRLLENPHQVFEYDRKSGTRRVVGGRK